MLVTPLLLLTLFKGCDAEYHNKPINVTRSTLPAVSAYRSSTSDWLTPEIIRLGEMKAQYGEDATSLRAISTDCIAYPRPAPRKIGRLLLELLKNLEGDQSTQVLELIQVLLRNNILVETSMLEMEPNLGSLVKTQGVMMGEPHATFPRILAVVWTLATNGNHGWCYIDKMNEYLTISKPREIAQRMKTIEPVLARGRFVMEDFIQSITPVNMYQKKTSRNTFKYPTTQTKRITTKSKVTSKKRHAIKQRANPKMDFQRFQNTTPSSNSLSKTFKQWVPKNVVPVKQVDYINGSSRVWSSQTLFLLFLFLV